MGVIGELERDGLIAGDYPTETMGITIVNDTAEDMSFLRGDIIAQTENSYKLAGDDDEAVGIICDDVVVSAGEEAESVMYIKGEFNRRKLRVDGELSVHERRMIEIGLIIRSTRI
ncbi:MAG: hypothetical protein FWB75_06340 [Oscillospiraceae bacterium]|nr:hypothetical protein [Oscillospiraceae bacterium]